jgi:phosphoribosyl 1,2-cyclic phosphodiesterase
MRKLTVHVMDDSPSHLQIVRGLLEKNGHAVTTSTSSEEALRTIPGEKPDCVLVDLMMPGIDGYEVCRRLRAMEELRSTRLIVVSAKSFPFDRRRAAELGADGYFTKPVTPATFVAELERLVVGTLTLTFWGVRGTLPVSRPDSHRYGGNTLCVSLAFPDGKLFVFDAGTGIKALSDALLTAQRTRIEGTIFISHPHWDHINALPFFAPFYIPGNRFEICGPSHGDMTVQALIQAQMSGPFSPITVRDFAASVTYRDLGEGDTEINGLPIRTMMLNHPGNCLGYRIGHPRAAICYVTDNELYPADSPLRVEEYVERLAEFCRDADVLITDCTYTDEAYPPKRQWGHSSASQVAELAWRARARRLYLVHHDPDDTDTVIDAKRTQVETWLASRGAATAVLSPTELTQIEL